MRILHEDPDVIVIEKDAGVLTQETRRGGEHCVEGALTDYVRKGQARSRKCVYLVHRLDRETSGVMMVAKTPEAQEYFRSRWNEVTEKTYMALVEGELAEDSGVFESFLAEDADGYKVRSVADESRGKFARTEWKATARGKGVTAVEVSLKSGRKNQIRVHFSEAGHPVVGDVKYGAHKAARMFLHASRLAFVHPHDGKRLEFSSPPPSEFGAGKRVSR